jgi:hypothetical protein
MNARCCPRRLVSGARPPSRWFQVFAWDRCAIHQLVANGQNQTGMEPGLIGPLGVKTVLCRTRNSEVAVADAGLVQPWSRTGQGLVTAGRSSTLLICLAILPSSEGHERNRQLGFCERLLRKIAILGADHVTTEGKLA